MLGVVWPWPEERVSRYCGQLLMTLGSSFGDGQCQSQSVIVRCRQEPAYSLATTADLDNYCNDYCNDILRTSTPFTTTNVKVSLPEPAKWTNVYIQMCTSTRLVPLLYCP